MLLTKGTIVECTSDDLMLSPTYLRQLDTIYVKGNYAWVDRQRYTIVKQLSDTQILLESDGVFSTYFTRNVKVGPKGQSYVVLRDFDAYSWYLKAVEVPLAIGQVRKQAGRSSVKIKALYDDKAILGGPGWHDHILSQKEVLKYSLISQG